MKSDYGNVVVEFTGIAIGMLIPVLFIATGCWNIAEGHLALRDAATSSARGFVLAHSRPQAVNRMNLIVNDIVSDYGINPKSVSRKYSCSSNSCTTAGTQVTVNLRYNIKFTIPIFGTFNIPISDTHTEQIDEVK